MFGQFLIGGAIVCATVVIEVGFIAISNRLLTKEQDWIRSGQRQFKLTIVLALVTLWLLGAFAASVWVWAGFFWMVGALAEFETSLYYASVTFTSLGYGDVTLDREWRLLSGVVAANGLILFSLTTAYLIEVVTRFRL